MVWPAPAMPAVDDEADRGWYASSAALAQGLEVIELQDWPPDAHAAMGGPVCGGESGAAGASSAAPAPGVSND